MTAKFAIIDSNRLTSIGLQHILEDIIPIAEIEVYGSFEEFVINQSSEHVHFFVASGIYFENAKFFLAQQRRSIVLVHGDNYPHLSGLLTLNVCQDEKSIVKQLMMLHHRGHGSDAHGRETERQMNQSILSERETDIAVLLAKGYINKEIADRLDIAMSTVITHRRNIMTKLQARSLANIIVYVVKNGLVSIDEL